MLHFTVKGIALDEETKMPIVILQSAATTRIIPLWIGPFEASAIIIEIEGVKPPRPLTHDLISEFFLKHHFQLKYLYIYDYIIDSHIARIIYKKGFRNYSLGIRPSDGIALALRLNAPIYVSPEVAGASYSDPELLRKTGIYNAEMLYFNGDISKTPIM